MMIFQHPDHEVFFIEEDDEHICFVSDCSKCQFAHKCEIKELEEDEQ